MPDTQPRLPPIDNREALRRTVQEFPALASQNVYILQLATAADEAPPWWSPRRDEYLDKFWPTEPYLAGAVYTVTSRNASFRYELTGPEKDVWWAQRLLTQADFGQGWQSFITKVTTDFLVMGNGSFFEVIRPAKAQTKSATYDAICVPTANGATWYPFDSHSGKILDTLVQDEDFKLVDTPYSLPIGLAHLDSRRCTRTGDPMFPVIYTDMLGQDHKLSWYQVVTLEEMPSPRQEMNGVQHCLHRDSIVHMADGSVRYIADLVRSHSTENVLSIDTNGQLVARRIVGWHENKLGDRSWVNIRCKYAKNGRKRWDHSSWVTNDHPILTPDGWVNAGDLQPGDKIVTSCPSPTKKHRALIIGTVLGDGSVTCANSTPRMHLGHKTDNQDWLDLKIRVLADFGWSISRYVTKWSSMMRGSCKVQPCLYEYRSSFYPGGNKTIPIDLIEECMLDDEMRPVFLAAWYLDDGHIRNRDGVRGRRPSISIGCVASDPLLVERVAALFTRLGYKASAVSSGFSRGDKYIGSKNLLFSVDASERIFAEIASYVPASMRYKLPNNSKPYDDSRWDFGKMGLFVDEVEIGYGKPMRAMRKTTFCIDVEETHNFISSNIVVHNCAVDRALRLSQILRDMLIYKQEKISGRFARAVHITNADARQLQDAVDQANSNADDRGLTRYMQPVILSTVDPSADPRVATIPLATLPDGFSEEDTMRWYVAGLANAFGVDYGFLAPLPGNKLGTSTQAETQERQSKGKSSRLFMQLITHKFNYSGILPRTVKFEFAVADPWEESEKDRAQASRMRSYQTMIQSGLLPIEIVQQIAADRGDIDPKYLELMGLSDLTPIITVGSTDVQRVTRHRTPRLTPEQMQLPMPEQSQPPRPAGEEEAE